MLSRYEQFSFLISGLYRDIQKIERDEMVKCGYKGAYAQYLVAMNRYPDGVTSAQLCEICDKDKAAISRVVAEMEEKGLAQRVTDKDTMYRARICLTEEGKRAAAFVSRRAQAAVEAAGRGLTEENRTIFYATLGRIAGNLQEISKSGIPQEEE